MGTKNEGKLFSYHEGAGIPKVSRKETDKSVKNANGKHQRKEETTKPQRRTETLQAKELGKEQMRLPQSGRVRAA